MKWTPSQWMWAIAVLLILIAIYGQGQPVRQRTEAERFRDETEFRLWKLRQTLCDGGDQEACEKLKESESE